MTLKCYVGNYDGLRHGMIFARSKREAAKIIGCSLYHFDNYWQWLPTPHPGMPQKALTLYTKSNHHGDWQEGICQMNWIKGHEFRSRGKE